jgi:hypothetical protein
MKRWSILGLILAVAVGCQSDPMASKKTEEVKEERTESVVATVTAVDPATRQVSLKNDKGEEMSFVASEVVKNLPQVKVGDKVKLTYYRSVAARLRQPGDTATDTEVVVDRAPVGEKPGAFARESKTVVAKVLQLDRAARTITIKTNEGKTVTASVRDPKNLEKVKVGDELTITYVEGYAVAVEGAE